MDMDIPKAKKCLYYTCSMCGHFLYTIEIALSDSTRKYRNLLYTNHTRVSDDDDIEFIVDPIKEYKCQKKYPVNRKASPIESTSYYIYYHDMIGKEYPRTYEESYKVQEVEYQDNPVSMKRQEYLFVIF